MRIIRYSKTLQMYPWMSYDLVPLREVKEQEITSADAFDKIVQAVKEAGFAYVLVHQSGEVLIERADQTG